MSATSWFGNLQLAYKYIVVFCSLLVLAFVAGLIKVLFDRRKLKKNVQIEELEAGPKEETVELTQTQREKDEGDLFGIRAIEAGFYAGVAQSRPGSRAESRAGSVHHPNMSSSTLVGGANSPFLKDHSGSSSISFNKSPTSERTTSPALKLRPSEAELTGSHGAVDMSRYVSPSPVTSQRQSPTSSSSTTAASTPYGMSPRSASFSTHEHYAPVPQNSGLQVTYHNGADTSATSQTASFNSSPQDSPTLPPPSTHMPTLPENTFDSRSPSPPRSYRPTHKRVDSDTSSTYSHHRTSTFDAYRAYQAQLRLRDPQSRLSSLTDSSRGSSILALPIQSAAPPPRESRLSDFYDAYWSDSSVGPVQILSAQRVVGRQSTIVEVESPVGSPALGRRMKLPGVGR